MNKPAGTLNGKGVQSRQSSLSFKKLNGPKCPRCCGLLKKRNNAQGKYYECPRHGFVRDVMSPTSYKEILK